MPWRPMSSIITQNEAPPYLLDAGTCESVEDVLRRGGFSVDHVDVGNLGSEAEMALLVGKVLDFPDYYRGGWDGFFDLLSAEFQERPRRVAVGLLNADRLARRDLKLFVRTSWDLLNASETVEADGKGEWQLEFLYWGDWQR